MTTSRFALVVALSPEAGLLLSREEVSSESGLRRNKGCVVEEEHVLYDAFLQEGVCELLVGRMLSIAQELFDTNILVGEDDTRTHVPVR